MGGFGQMLCSCGSFSMICQWSHTDLENCFLLMSMESRLGGQIWNLMPLGFCTEECHENGEGLQKCCERSLLMDIFWQGEIL